jgi:hypothetical protein
MKIVLGAYRRKALLVDVIEHDRLRHCHVGRTFLEQHLAELWRGPSAGERLVGIRDAVGFVLPLRPLHFADLEVPLPIKRATGPFQIVVR